MDERGLIAGPDGNVSARVDAGTILVTPAGLSKGRCRIEDLVNFLAALSAQPELTATEEIRFGTSHPKQKTMPIRLTLSGLVARRLVPARKGLSDF